MLWGAAPVAVRVADAPSGFALLEVGGIDTPDDAGDVGPEAVPAPLPIEMAELLSYPRRLWRREGFEVFSWSLYPEVLWVDSRDYAAQARMFRRLAFFVEKEGYQGTLLTNDVLAGLHGWNAHNYNPDGLAAFFNAAAEQAFPLNDEERTLLAIAVNNGWLRPPRKGRLFPVLEGFWRSAKRVIRPASVALGSRGDARCVLRRNGVRNGVFRYWEEAMTAEERGFWRLFFGWMSYSPEDTYLMVNEMQAYLLQQREVAIRWYFRSRTADTVAWLAAGTLCGDRRRFLADHPDTFVRAGAEINGCCFRKPEW